VLRCVLSAYPRSFHAQALWSLRPLISASQELGPRQYPKSGTPSPPPVQAKWRYCLRDADLAGLPHALDANPIDPAFDPMQLLRRVDVVAAAVARWGSLHSAAAEHRKRICR
jgi:hypothetical protein